MAANPPSVPSVEVSVLGACLDSPVAVGHAIEILSPKDFFSRENQQVFAAIKAVFEQGGKPDVNSVMGFLPPGFESHLAGLLINAGHAGNVPVEARVIKEKSMLRQLGALSTSISHHSGIDLTDPFELIEKTEKALIEISSGSGANSSMAHMETLVHLAATEIDEMASPEARKKRVLTGFNSYDYMTNGWPRKRLIVVAGRPSMGKTAFALNCARNISTSKGVGMFSLEMSKEELTLRMLCSECGIMYNDLQAGRVRTTRKSLADGMKTLSLLNLTIDDGAALTVHQIKARTERMIRERQIVGVIIDYLQLMSAPTARSRDEEVGIVTHALKAMAKELGIFVVLLSQLNRGVEGRRNKRPLLSDLRESGNIEQDADDVVFLHRPEHYDETDKPGVAEVIIGKQRNGGVGVAELVFVKEHMRFENPPPPGMENMEPPPEQDDTRYGS